MHLDKVFSCIGEFGIYQRVLAIIYFLQNVMLGWQMVGIAFLGADVGFYCYTEEFRNLTFSQQQMMQFKDERPTCEIYDITSGKFNVTDAKQYNNISYRKKECDTHWVYDETVFSKTLASNFQLCSRSIEYWSQTILNFGVFLGCFFVGYFSDKYGRKKAIMLFQSIWILDGVVGALLPHPLLWIASRFVMGFSAFGCFDASYVLAMETTGIKGRAIQSILFQLYYAVGIASLAGIAWLVPDFLYLQLIMSTFPIILLILYWFLLDESPRWLISKNRYDEATDIIVKIAKWNQLDSVSDVDLSNEESHSKCPTFFDLFKTPNLRKTTLAMWVSWFAVTTGYYGLTFGVENLSGNLFLNHFLSGLIEFPAYFVSYIFIRKFSRKYTTAIAYFCVAFLLFMLGLIGFAGYDFADTQVVIVMTGKFFSSIVFALLYLNAAEVFPTALRTVGVGSSSSMARIGGILQPQIQHLQEIIPHIHYILYGVITLVGCFGTFFIPETLNRKLPETISDAENYDCQDKNSDASDMELS